MADTADHRGAFFIAGAANFDTMVNVVGDSDTVRIETLMKVFHCGILTVCKDKNNQRQAMFVAKCEGCNHGIVHKTSVANGFDDRPLGQGKFDAEGISQALSQTARRPKESEWVIPREVSPNAGLVDNGLV